MPRDPDVEQPPIPAVESPDAQRPDQPPTGIDVLGPDGYDTTDPDSVDKGYWINCIDDAERAEQEWRARGREIIQIYRSASKAGKAAKSTATFNVLYSNTEVMLPVIYSQPPEPVVRSRFIKMRDPMQMMAQLQAQQMPAGLPAAGPGVPPGPPNPSVGSPPDGGAPLPPDGAPGVPPPQPGAAANGAPPVQVPQAPPPGGLPSPPPMQPMGGIGGGQQPAPGGLPPSAPPMPGMAGPGMPQPAPQRPNQSDIDTAAAIIEKCLEIVTDDEHSAEAVKLAVKDVLLPGRGACRVRWRPQMVQQPVMAGDGLTPLPGPDGSPQTQDVKIWEQVGDEYVYWEDLLCDPVRAAADTNWISFRHLFTRESLETEFSGSAQYDKIKSAGRLSDLFKWTDESAAKYPVGGGSAMKTASRLGDYIKKAMVWEIWDRTRKQIIWFMRESGGVVLRVDPDSYQLSGFFPIPIPMLSIRTSDSRIPVPFYDTYAKLASDLDETSSRISDMTRKVKATGAYNAASKDVADLLLLDDGKMIGVEGVDMLSGGLQNHIWMRPIDIYVAALQQLYLARNQIKDAIYEIMGISDIMRGSTVPSETATAQRIKTGMGMSRLQDNKDQVANFCTDLMRLKAELICKNFDAATLEGMTGEQVTPEVMDILRSDFMRTCSVDIESESTVAIDEKEEQESMAMVVQSMTAVMQGAMGMLQSGILPPDKVVQLSLEMLKMLLHPVRHSRPVIELIDDFQEQLQLQAAVAAMMPPAPMVPPPGQPGVPAPPGGPMRGVSHSPPHVGGARGVPPGANGGAPPPGPPQAPGPPVAQPVQ